MADPKKIIVCVVGENRKWAWWFCDLAVPGNCWVHDVVHEFFDISFEFDSQIGEKEEN